MLLSFVFTHTKIGFLTFYEVYMIDSATVGACARGYICFIMINLSGLQKG